MTIPARASTIHNPTTGQVIPASWGDAVNEDLDWLMANRHFCAVSNSANQNVSSGTNFAVPMNTETNDIGGMHSTVSNTSRVTAPDTTVYNITANAEFTATDIDGQRIFQIRLNGSVPIAAESKGGAGGIGNPSASLVRTLFLAAGDYVELLVFQDSGSTLQVVASSFYTPHLTVEATR